MKFIYTNLTIPYNLNKQFPTVVPTHLHQDKTFNTYTNFGPTIMSKISIIRVN